MRSLVRLGHAALVLALLPVSPVFGAVPGPRPAETRARPAHSGDPLHPASHGRFLDRTNTLVTLGLGAAALLSTEIEDPGGVSRALDRSHLDGGLDVGNTYGDGLVLGSTALGLVALGNLADSPRLTAAGTDLTQSLLAAWSVTWVLKVGVNARRPDGGPHSFPSGHAATAFAAAPVFARHFGRGVGTVAYGLAGLTALGRMEDRRHYAADVLFGAAIGIVAGRTFSGNGGFRLVLPPQGRGVGFEVAFR